MSTYPCRCCGTIIPVGTPPHNSPCGLPCINGHACEASDVGRCPHMHEYHTNLCPCGCGEGRHDRFNYHLDDAPPYEEICYRFPSSKGAGHRRFPPAPRNLGRNVSGRR